MILKLFPKLLLLVCVSACAVAQTEDDVAQSADLARKYKKDDVACLSAHHYFTFDKGKNTLGEKVVVVDEEAELDFISLKKFAGLTYPEFYNKFIQLKTFKKSIKTGNKYVTSLKAGVDHAVTEDGIFFDDSRVQYYPIRFDQKGAMARINVKKEYLDGKYLTRLFFNMPYPVKEEVYEFKVPDWLSVDFKSMNFDGYKIDKKETKKGGYINYVFTMKDIPAIAHEFKSVGRAYREPHIVIQIKSFESKGETLKGFDTVNDTYNWNNKLYKLAGNETGKLKPVTEKIVQGKTTDIDKIKAIYYWVQDNIRYIAYEDGYSGYIPASAQDVLTKKYGDCKGMANLMTEMLKLAGFDAHFTWIGTRSIPYPQSLPALCVNNHAITTLYFNGKTYFLDATEKYAPFGEDAFRIQGKEAMIAKGENFEIKQVPLTTGNDHKVQTKASFALTGNALTGTVKVTLTGNERTDFQQSYQQLPVTSRDEFLNAMLEFGNDNMQASNIKTSDLMNREIPVTIEGQVNLQNNVNAIENDKYVSIDFFPKSLDRYTPDEKRTTGYDFDYVLSYEDEIALTVPADMKFTDIPAKLELDNSNYSFKGEYTVAGNIITLRKTLTIKNNVIKQADFANWTKFLESIREFNRYFLTVSKKA